MSAPPESLPDFIDEVPTSEKTLLLLNRTGPEPLATLLKNAFATQDVTVAERQVPNGTDDLICLIDEGRVVTTSPFERLKASFLLVNVDRYRTGARPVDPERFPDVLTGLNDVEFTVRGFPASNKEKLLLTLISRFIEHLALSTGTGQLHTTFQRLSLLDDEYGTKTLYEWLGESDVETHVYGVADDPTVVSDLDLSVHSDNTAPYRRSWVLAFRAAEGTTVGDRLPTHAAMVAIQTGSNVYRGLWTYDSARVNRVLAYIDEAF